MDKNGSLRSNGLDESQRDLSVQRPGGFLCALTVLLGPGGLTCQNHCRSPDETPARVPTPAADAVSPGDP